MINVQNEIKYAAAFGILKKLFAEGFLENGEFELAHRIIAERFGPETVRQLP